VLELERISEGILKNIDAKERPLTYETVGQHDDTQAQDDERKFHTSTSRERSRSRARSRTKASSRYLAIGEDYDDDVAESTPASRRVGRSAMKVYDGDTNSDIQI
jgi:hypothetical protein